jgi:tetratricopeptide (TPR) repeat protein
MKLMLGALAIGGLLAGCALLGPPPFPGGGESGGGNGQVQERTAPPYGSGPAGAAPAQPAPFEGGGAQPQEPGAAPPRQFSLGPAATALVGEAHAQERGRNFGVAAQTLERALSIEPHNPLVWIELGRENILAGNPAQAYGMGRKALYLASGDPRTQARAWQLIAAALREQGRNGAAYAAEEKAAALSPN